MWFTRELLTVNLRKANFNYKLQKQFQTNQIIKKLTTQASFLPLMETNYQKLSFLLAHVRFKRFFTTRQASMKISETNLKTCQRLTRVFWVKKAPKISFIYLYLVLMTASVWALIKAKSLFVQTTSMNENIYYWRKLLKNFSQWSSPTAQQFLFMHLNFIRW